MPNEPTPFPAQLPVKRISVNSFGYGGTNAHMIIESADSLLSQSQTYKYLSPDDRQQRAKVPRRAFYRNRPFLLPFSAHDKPTLKRNIEAHGQVAGRYNLLDLSYTLANRRSRFPSRGFAVASHANLESVFRNVAEGFSFADKKKTPTVGFAFTGQGAQWARMGAELMAYYPSFLRSIRILDRALEDLPDAPDWTLEDTLLEDAQTSRVSEAEFSQPLCTAIQIAIVQLLQLWGIRPVVTCGHSSGEIAASFAAGLISATEAIIVAYYRGKVVRDVNTDGAMMAVGLGAEAVAPFVEEAKGKIVIACHNSPMGVTLSGDATALETVKNKLDAENIFARLVKTNGKAYHSHHMKPVAAKYEALVRQAKTSSPFDLPTPTNARMVSSVTNSIIPYDTIIDETYWSANLRSPVLFNQAVQTIMTSPEFGDVDMLIEIGPHSALSGPIKQIKSDLGLEKLGYLPTLLRGTDSATQMLKLAGEMFLRDYPLDMDRITSLEEPLRSGKIHATRGCLLVDLPTYQWNYAKNLWAEARMSREHRSPKFPRHDILGSLAPGGSLAEPTWRNVMRICDVPWLKDHSLGGEAVFPAAAYFSMAMEAMTQLNEISASPVAIEGFVLRDISIKAALVTPGDTGIEVLFNMRPSIYSEADPQTTWRDFSVSSISEDGHRNDHMTGSISINTRPRGQPAKAVPDFPQRASGKSWNQALRDVGFDYGPTFQDMEDIRFDGITYGASCKTAIKNEVGTMTGESRHVIHPAVVDSCLQLLIVSIYAGRTNAMACGAVPIQVDEVAIWTPTQAQLDCGTAKAYSWIDQRGVRSFVGGNQLVANDGEVLMEISDMRCTLYEAAVPQRADEPLKPQPYGEMVWKYDFDSLKTTSDIGELDVSELVELAAFKNPGLKVLEIGSAHANTILSKSENLHYTVTESTDETAGYLEAFAGAFKNAKTKKVDFSRELNGQDVKKSSFDMVIAPGELPGPMVLHNIHKLLVPGGRVIWESTENPSIEALEAAGFSGVNLFVGRNGKPTIALSTASKSALNGEVNGVSNETNGLLHEVQLVYRNKPAPIISQVKEAFEKLGWHTTTTSLGSLTKAGEHVIVLADFEGPLLATLEENELAPIQEITNNATSVLWATPGGLLSGKKPEYAMAAGLARSVTSEQATLNFTTVDFDLDNTSSVDVTDTILKIAQRQSEKGTSMESEYYISKGLTYISRLLPNDDINRVYSIDEKDVKTADFDPEESLVGKIQSGKVVFHSDERTGEPLHEDKVEVQVTVSGLNKESVLVIAGSDYPTTFSHEIGGIVRKVGSEVTGFEVGDRVAGFSFDKFATFQKVPATLLQKVEKQESLDEIASLPMAYGAALYGLKSLANLEVGETVLILEGAGLAGIAAVKVAQLMNAVPYVAVQNETEAQFVASQFGLPEAQVLLPSKLSVLAQLKTLTGGNGADVVFSSGWVDSTIAREAWRCIAPFGRFVDCGRKNVLKRSALDTVPLHQGANYLSFDMLDLYDRKPQILSQLLSLTVGLYRQGSISALRPLSLKNITELNSAVAAFSDSLTAGKTMIVHEKSDGQLNVLPKVPSMRFRPDATYLLVGCLGGLGRSLTSWMMMKGARHFAFLSRSGADSKQASVLVKDIEAAGVSVQVIRGDATSKADVERAVKSVPTEHPIRGVVQAAMVLRVGQSLHALPFWLTLPFQDGLFHSMTYDSWKTSTRPKVQGTKNLHEALEGVPLDFFVMTSSVSGTLGTPGQSNYAAGNSYLDALARHRNYKGQSAAAIVLPMVLGVGVVAENLELEEALKRKGMYGIDEEHLLESFEVSIAIQGTEGAADHVVVGLDPSRLQKAIKDADALDGFWMEDARFESLLETMKSGADAAGAGGQSVLSTIRSAAVPAEAVQAAREHFVNKLSKMLLLDPEEFEEGTKSIADYGLDSMIGAELRNWIFKEFALDIPFQQLLGPTLTIDKFAAQVCANQGVAVE